MNDTVIIQHFVTLKKKNENEEKIRLTICKINLKEKKRSPMHKGSGVTARI